MAEIEERNARSINASWKNCTSFTVLSCSISTFSSFWTKRNVPFVLQWFSISVLFSLSYSLGSFYFFIFYCTCHNVPNICLGFIIFLSLERTTIFAPTFINLTIDSCLGLCSTFTLLILPENGMITVKVESSHCSPENSYPHNA